MTHLMLLKCLKMAPGCAELPEIKRVTFLTGDIFTWLSF